jgi:hypothetical protein
LNSLSLSAWRWAWVGLCLANLVLPMFLGWVVTGNGGRVGMLAAVALILVRGRVLVERWARVRVALAIGGIATAVLQACPILQLAAGCLSLWVVDQMGYRIGGLTELGGFLVTLLTAVLMILVALAFGGTFQILCWALEPSQDRVLHRARSASLPEH